VGQVAVELVNVLATQGQLLALMLVQCRGKQIRMVREVGFPMEVLALLDSTTILESELVVVAAVQVELEQLQQLAQVASGAQVFPS
jgi:hypothetical protein